MTHCNPATRMRSQLLQAEVNDTLRAIELLYEVQLERVTEIERRVTFVEMQANHISEQIRERGI
jgi:hypothetical protein